MCSFLCSESNFRFGVDAFAFSVCGFCFVLLQVVIACFDSDGSEVSVRV